MGWSVNKRCRPNVGRGDTRSEEREARDGRVVSLLWSSPGIKKSRVEMCSPPGLFTLCLFQLTLPAYFPVGLHKN